MPIKFGTDERKNSRISSYKWYKSYCGDSQPGKADEAIAAYQTAISIDPNYTPAHYNLGNAYQQQGKYDLAIDSYKKAIAINPNYTQAHYHFARIYALKNEKALAIESLQKIITLNRNWIKYSKTESDFDNIRESPEFQKLINSVEY